MLLWLHPRQALPAAPLQVSWRRYPGTPSATGIELSGKRSTYSPCGCAVAGQNSLQNVSRKCIDRGFKAALGALHLCLQAVAGFEDLALRCFLCLGDRGVALLGPRLLL